MRDLRGPSRPTNGGPPNGTDLGYHSCKTKKKNVLEKGAKKTCVLANFCQKKLLALSLSLSALAIVVVMNCSCFKVSTAVEMKTKKGSIPS